MRRAFIALGLLVVFAAPAGAGSLGVFGSWWDADEADDDFGAGVKLDFPVGRVDLGIRATFYDDQAIKAGGGVLAFGGQLATFRASIVDFGFAYNFLKEGRSFNPYVGAGGSYYFLDMDKDDLGRLDDEAGWFVQLGAEARIGQSWMFFVEGLYREAEATLEGNDLGFSPAVDLGFDLKGPAVNVGVAFDW